MLVAIIGRITGAAGTCIASTVGTVGTAGTAVGIPVTGAPRTSCSNLEVQDRHHRSAPSSLPTYPEPPAPTPSRRSHFLMAEPYLGPVKACRFQDSVALVLGWLLHSLSRALQGHLRLHFLQAFLAALAGDAGTRAWDHRSSCTRESRGWPRPGHCCCSRCQHYYRLGLATAAAVGPAVLLSGFVRVGACR